MGVQFVAIAFRRTDEGQLTADAPIACGTALEAARRAESLDRINDGAIAFSAIGDFALDKLSNAKIIRGFGEIPSEIFDQLT